MKLMCGVLKRCRSPVEWTGLVWPAPPGVGEVHMMIYTIIESSTYSGHDPKMAWLLVTRTIESSDEQQKMEGFREGVAGL